ncbi:TadE/TadG family type IV pilus assembly protein [Neorhizobium sp. SOG26]|jgi:Flp pilus assembly protein TadG|uniref:TadE/TadG family type IV pilus assembly protein n=1 Tax=Neorhizobium sp. SOG26 TaxID=2060726 RepID=UPI0026AB127C
MVGMRQDCDVIHDSSDTKPKRKGVWRRILRSDDGAAAIEFTILAIPYFIIVFAIVETFIAFTGEQLISNAVDTLSRKIRTGQITNTMKTEQFRQAFCEEISIMIQCDANEVAQPNKLLLDVRSYASFADIPKTLPINSAGDIDGASFGFAPGKQNTINMVRAFYKWNIITDILRPMLSTIKPAGDDSGYFLIVETSAFRNEDYP